ncbi:MAG: winged helix-turn-helix domain-containing protein [Thermodesulfobacteriota bacterium]
MVSRKYSEDRPQREPVRISSWLASKQSTDPTRIKVLEAVVDLAAEDHWISSREVRDRTGLSQQLVQGYLEELEREGLVDLDSNNGVPPKVLPTNQGFKALGRSEEPAPRPVSLTRRLVQPSDEEVDELAQRLYQRLEDHLLDLDRSQTEQLLRRVLSEVKSRPQDQPEPPAQRPARAKAAPAPQEQVNILDQLEAELAAELESPQPDLASWAEQEPPALPAAEARLEQELTRSAFPDYQDLQWYERTQELMDVWDRARRRNLGLLGTFFTSFRPRWKYAQWEAFNQARRQADELGANYEQWVKAQFQRLSIDSQVEVQPNQLHGQEAARAYQASLAPAAPAAAPAFEPAAAPVMAAGDAGTAEALLAQLEGLAASVYGDDPRGPAILAVEAVKRGNLPLAALDLRPAWKAQVLECLTPTLSGVAAPAPVQAPVAPAPAFGTSGPDYGGHPPLII